MTDPGSTPPPLLEVRGLEGGHGRIQALFGVDLEVCQGELVVLVGANGAGKTTLLRTLSGVLPASGGSVTFAGADITRLAPSRRVERGIAQVPEGRHLFGPLTVEENLRLGGYTRPARDLPASLERVYALLPALAPLRKHTAANLSGGQQQMVAMARALMACPRLLLLDEPSMGLSPRLVDETFATIAQLRQENVTIFLVEQNAYQALAIADRGYVLDSGRITLSGTGPNLLANPEVQAAYLEL